MSGVDCSVKGHRTGRVLIGVLMCWAAGAAQPAAAQNPFEALFGSRYYHRPEPLPPQTSFYAEPAGPSSRATHRPYRGYSRSVGRSAGGGTTFCVRTCDGRYFPLGRLAGISPAETCRSFCPASETMVFSGSKIDHAVAQNGKRYVDLENAFLYRNRVVANCTCNGKDALGLARQSIAADPTLRRGDVVATNDGFMTYRGRHAKAAAFTPIDPSSSAWARKLSEIRVRPAPQASKQDGALPSEQAAIAVTRRHTRDAQLER